MGFGWRDWSKSDIIYGVLVPVIAVLAIVGLSRLGSALGFGSYGAVIGIIMELEELTVIVVVPLLLGLIWNRWAVGACGFLMGSLYALYWADKFGQLSILGFHASGDMILLGYVLSAMLIGYMAGALNKRSGLSQNDYLWSNRNNRRRTTAFRSLPAFARKRSVGVRWLSFNSAPMNRMWSNYSSEAKAFFRYWMA